MSSTSKTKGPRSGTRTLSLGDQAGSGPGDQAGSGPGDQAGSGPGDQAGSAPGDQAGSRFDRVAATVKRALRARRMTYRQLGEAIGLSESGVKKLLGSRDGSLNRLSAIADVLGVPLPELIGAAEREAFEAVRLSESQQRFLLRNPACFAFYWLLAVEGRSVADIRRRHRVDARRARRFLSRLDDLGLVALEAGDRVRVLHPGLARWDDRGPLMDHLNRTWSRALIADCLAHLDDAGHTFRLHFLRLRTESATELRHSLAELIDDFRRRSRRETLTTAEAGLEPVSLLAATAPRSFVTRVSAETGAATDGPLPRGRQSP